MIHDTTDRFDRFDRSIDRPTRHRPTISSRAVDVHRPVVTGRSWTHSTSPRANQKSRDCTRDLSLGGGTHRRVVTHHGVPSPAPTDRPTDRPLGARDLSRRPEEWSTIAGIRVGQTIVVRSRDSATRERERAPRTGVNDEGRARSCARSWARIAACARRARGKGAWKVREDT